MPVIVVPGDPARPDFDPSSLLELVGDDRAFLEEFVVLFEQDAARLTREIRGAMARGDAESLERSAHSLKGVLSHFGESDALGFSRRLEALGSERTLEGAGPIGFALIDEIALIQKGLARLIL